MLTAEQIKAANDRPVKTIPVPEWGGDVAIRQFSGRERDRYDAWTASIRGREDFAALWGTGILLLHLCDADGRRVFTFEKMSDLTPLADEWAESRSEIVLARLFKECDAISLLTKKSLEKKSDNSAGDRKSDSGTSSPESTADSSTSSTS